MLSTEEGKKKQIIIDVTFRMLSHSQDQLKDTDVSNICDQRVKKKEEENGNIL